MAPTKRTTPAAATGPKKKTVAFTADTKKAAVPKGVVAAAPKKKAAAKKNVKMVDNSESDAEDDESGDDDFDMDSDEVSSDEGEDRIMAVEFRFLPSQFQEPELRQYLSQFGSKVNKAVCLRHKITDSSRGIALVTWKDDSVIPTVLEDCNGMLLGGRTVRCRRVFLKRDLPAQRIVARRHMSDIQRRTRGAKMTRFVNKKHQDTETGSKAANVAKAAQEKVVKTKDIVGGLIKYSNQEKEHNKALKAMGINYSFNGFTTQYKQVPKSQIITKKEMRAKRNRGSEDE